VVWRRTTDADEAELRVVPDGCMDLIWGDGGLLVAGPDTRPHVTPADPGTTYIGLRFSPGTGPAVIGVPADALRDQRVPLDDVWPRMQVQNLAEEIAGAANPVPALESLAATRLRTDSPDPAAPAIVAELSAGSSVAEAAQTLGFSERQLHRRCRAAFGYGPKTLGRILRFGEALELSQSGTPFGIVAGLAGYTDQAHMSREVKALTGLTLGQLVRPT
jgi:AraC-like DNA-binding protein